MEAPHGGVSAVCQMLSVRYSSFPIRTTACVRIVHIVYEQYVRRESSHHCACAASKPPCRKPCSTTNSESCLQDSNTGFAFRFLEHSLGISGDPRRLRDSVNPPIVVQLARPALRDTHGHIYAFTCSRNGNNAGLRNGLHN